MDGGDRGGVPLRVRGGAGGDALGLVPAGVGRRLGSLSSLTPAPRATPPRGRTARGSATCDTWTTRTRAGLRCCRRRLATKGDGGDEHTATAAMDRGAEAHGGRRGRRRRAVVERGARRRRAVGDPRA